MSSSVSDLSRDWEGRSRHPLPLTFLPSTRLIRRSKNTGPQGEGPTKGSRRPHLSDSLSGLLDPFLKGVKRRIVFQLPLPSISGGVSH